MNRFLVAAAAATFALALAAPVARAADCQEQPLERTFLPWLDLAWYFPAPDGSFEDGGDWTLTGGASVTDGNQPHFAGSKSLHLPAGSTATTARLCVTVAHPTIRLFARNTGDPLAPLTVTVLFRTPGGVPVEVPVGTIFGDDDWQPTPPLPVVGNLVAEAVRFSFESAPGGDWRIDDVFVDPYSKG